MPKLVIWEAAAATGLPVSCQNNKAYLHASVGYGEMSLPTPFC